MAFQEVNIPLVGPYCGRNSNVDKSLDFGEIDVLCPSGLLTAGFRNCIAEVRSNYNVAKNKKGALLADQYNIFQVCVYESYLLEGVTELN